MSNYTPSIGDQVWCIVNGPDLVVLDRIGRRIYTNDFVELIPGSGVGGTGQLGFVPDGEYGPYYYSQEGPSAFSNYGNYIYLDNSVVRYTPYVLPGDVPVFGSSRAVLPRQLVGPSKVLMIGISAYISPYANSSSGSVGRGWMCTQISPDAALLRDYYYPATLWDSISYCGEVDSGAVMSRWSFWKFQETGYHSIGLAFAAEGSPCSFSRIEVWAIPL